MFYTPVKSCLVLVAYETYIVRNVRALCTGVRFNQNDSELYSLNSGTIFTGGLPCKVRICKLLTHVMTPFQLRI